MKSFKRLFAYIWPQKASLLVVCVTTLMIGVLFFLSFATILPLLKVMMGEEGLRGWIDRSVCQKQYEVEFYVPGKADFLAEDSDHIAYYILVTSVKEDSAAYEAGLRAQDRIVGADTVLLKDSSDKILSPELMKALANSQENHDMVVQVRRTDLQGIVSEKIETIIVPTGKKNLLMGAIQDATEFIPYDQSKDAVAKTVVIIILAMGVVTIFRCLATFLHTYIGGKIVQTAIANLRTDVFAHSMTLPMGFFSSEGTSDITSRLINDIAGTSKGLKILLGKALREPSKAIATLVLALAINWQLTLIFLTSAPAVIVLAGVLGRKIKKATKRSLMSSALVLGKLQEAMNAIGVVKVYNRQEYEKDVFDDVNKTYLRRILKVTKVDAATGPIMEVIGMVAGSAAMILGVYWVMNSNMESAEFFTLLVALGATAESSRKTSDIWNKVQQANAAAERIYAVADNPSETEKPNAGTTGTLKESIEFNDVCFSYPKSDKPVLDGVNLTIKAGQTVAVVGPNGSGKTTMINLLPRFYDPSAGQVIFDGKDIKDVTLTSLREQIGMVSQQVVTFNDTVADNIGYGKLDATREEVVAAAKRAFADEFITPLPDGYETIIGEHNSGFSGGQLQRIVIARAILKDPSILILDEAMSQVDADSEAKIHNALSELMLDRTCLVIAHRFSTIISADSIVVMNHGKVIAQGVHEELVKDCPLYKSLYETQIIH
ncbi:MAG: ATP-binding cassette domain-containing protein [Anaerohalosphaeraceae bacterium]|nr:ATP-binding cassette domain-containing protein [Anaerohalosphaeraceae bacterium]